MYSGCTHARRAAVTRTDAKNKKYLKKKPTVVRLQSAGSIGLRVDKQPTR